MDRESRYSDEGALTLSASSSCPICGTEAAHTEWRCPRCTVPHHAACAAYFGGCAIFGCREGASPGELEMRTWPVAVHTARQLARVRNVQALALSCAGLYLPCVIVQNFVSCVARWLGVPGVDWLCGAVFMLATAAAALSVLVYPLSFILSGWYGLSLRRAMPQLEAGPESDAVRVLERAVPPVARLRWVPLRALGTTAIAFQLLGWLYCLIVALTATRFEAEGLVLLWGISWSAGLVHAALQRSRGDLESLVHRLAAGETSPGMKEEKRPS